MYMHVHVPSMHSQLGVFVVKLHDGRGEFGHELETDRLALRLQADEGEPDGILDPGGRVQREEV